jgi:hypothetical protein
MSLILYVPNDMHSSQLSHICNKEVLLRPLQEAQYLQIKIFYAMKQSTHEEDTCYRDINGRM